MEFLKGYRTYIFAVATIAGAALALADGKTDFSGFLLACGPAVSAIFARIGAKNEAAAVAKKVG